VGEGDSTDQCRFSGGEEAVRMARLPHGTRGPFGTQRDGGSDRNGLAAAAAGNGQR
jgi:hypothetical protein